MSVSSDGKFTFEINAEDLARGLRPFRSNPRNIKYLTRCSGAVGIEGVLQTLADINLDAIETILDIADPFPYPQIFVFSSVVIVCGQTEIFEYSGGGLVSAIDGLVAGMTWSAADFWDYIYMVNGQQTVRRRAEDRVWEINPDVPDSSSCCNFNGQLFLGSPYMKRT